MASRVLVGLARAVGPAVVDAVLPPLCLGCNEIVGAPGSLCPSCWASLSFVAPPWCTCCSRPFARDAGPDALCGACAARPPRWRRARAVLVYDGRSRGLVLPFKHGDRTDMARACGRWMARAGAELVAGADLVAPVPLHWRRLFTRRYNQAQLLARATLAAAPPGGARLVPDLLQRRRWTAPQGGDARQRHDNVRQAFTVAPRHASRVAGRRVLLVDDVLTTGATAEACTLALQRAGAAAVDVLTLARVVRAAV